VRKFRQQPNAPPQKWRKYELLDDFDLADTDYLRRTIHRFSREHRTDFLAQLRAELMTATANGKRHGQQLFVMKFVPKKLAMLLPNIRVQDMDDLDAVERAIRDEPFGDYDEIWFCRTDVGTNRFSVAGRILVDSLAGMNGQIIEQVWRCSPRLIESMGPTFPYPFIRAARSGWGWSPRIQEIHIPPSAPESEAVIREQFTVALTKLERSREKLEAFVEAVLAIGLNVCCLEYKIEGERLQIIDWDTTNDRMVINKYLPNETT